jgi:hypothetical protein
MLAINALIAILIRILIVIVILDFIRLIWSLMYLNHILKIKI